CARHPAAPGYFFDSW
nr:immunoglobulin heavy chain junction region [Macaca mulatta]MOW76756.1 immunoglobulin heavy chain junction region [Macaca mulatta]MOW77217.1 immunoglobulin heavy chain junction region [Macaca mulatta]MOW78427.1 immunoglobulin heavy chain junction region [Macaca mulatta]MOW80357.1 immunoglobulin heavy chain junction region [Macaca mulatta]